MYSSITYGSDSVQCYKWSLWMRDIRGVYGRDCYVLGDCWSRRGTIVDAFSPLPVDRLRSRPPYQRHCNEKQIENPFNRCRHAILVVVIELFHKNGLETESTLNWTLVINNNLTASNFVDINTGIWSLFIEWMEKIVINFDEKNKRHTHPAAWPYCLDCVRGIIT